MIVGHGSPHTHKGRPYAAPAGSRTDYAGGKSRLFGSEIQMTVCASSEWRDRWPLPCVSSTSTKLPA